MLLLLLSVPHDAVDGSLVHGPACGVVRSSSCEFMVVARSAQPSVVVQRRLHRWTPQSRQRRTLSRHCACNAGPEVASTACDVSRHHVGHTHSQSSCIVASLLILCPARLEVRRMDSWWSEETSLCSEAHFTVDAQLALQSQAAFHLSRSSQDVHTVILLCMIRLVLCMLFQI